MKKKWLYLLLVIALCLGMAGCTSKKDEETVKPETEESRRTDREQAEADTLRGGVNKMSEDLESEEEEYDYDEDDYDEDDDPYEDDFYEEGEITYTDAWEITLPEGWERIWYELDGYTYTPGGDEYADSIVIISEAIDGTYTGYLRDMDEDELIESLEDYLGEEDLDDYDVTVIGETKIGYVIKISIYVDIEYGEIYMVEDEEVYLVLGMGVNGDMRGVEAAEYIIEHAVKR